MTLLMFSSGTCEGREVNIWEPLDQASPAPGWVPNTHQCVVKLEGADVVGGDVCGSQGLGDLGHDAAFIWGQRRGPRSALPAVGTQRSLGRSPTGLSSSCFSAWSPGAPGWTHRPLWWAYRPRACTPGDCLSCYVVETGCVLRFLNYRHIHFYFYKIRREGDEGLEWCLSNSGW